jgi:integrase/recombinase XerD
LLRVYWRWGHPKGWLFPGEKPGTPISKESIFKACQKAGQDAGISEAVHPPSLELLDPLDVVKAASTFQPER